MKSLAVFLVNNIKREIQQAANDSKNIICIKGINSAEVYCDICTQLNLYAYIKSFNRFLIISLDVLICRYSPLFRAFPALFISEEPHKSFYYPLCFRSQK